MLGVNFRPLINEAIRQKVGNRAVLRTCFLGSRAHRRISGFWWHRFRRCRHCQDPVFHLPGCICGDVDHASYARTSTHCLTACQNKLQSRGKQPYLPARQCVATRPIGFPRGEGRRPSRLAAPLSLASWNAPAYALLSPIVRVLRVRLKETLRATSLSPRGDWRSVIILMLLLVAPAQKMVPPRNCAPMNSLPSTTNNANGTQSAPLK